MNIHEDRSYIDTNAIWYHKGYAQENLHSLRLQFLYTEAEQAVNRQFHDTHTNEEWNQHMTLAGRERNAAMVPVIEAIAQQFICQKYAEEDSVSYFSDKWDLFFWCNHFNKESGLSGRDYSYFTLSFNQQQTMEKRKETCQQVLDLLRAQFKNHPNLNITIQYSTWYDLDKIDTDANKLIPLLQDRRCTYGKKEGRLLLQNGALFFKPKYAKRRIYELSGMDILSLSWELGVEAKEPDGDTPAVPVTLPFEKFGEIYEMQLQVTSYLNGNLAIQMLTMEDECLESWAFLTTNLPGLRKKDHAFIDINADSDFPIWLIRHGLAVPTGHTMQSGFCNYPEYRFRPERLQELDPDGYSAYLQIHEGRHSA